MRKGYHIVITLVELSILLMLFRIVWHLVFTSIISWLLIFDISCSEAKAQTPGIVGQAVNQSSSGQAYKVLETDHFSLVYSADIKEDEKIASLLELAYCHFQSLFNDCNCIAKQTQEKLKWVAFTNKDDFNLYAFNTENQDLSWLNGYYSAKTNAVAIVSPEKISKWQIRYREYEEQAANIIACPPDAETGLAKIVHEAAHQLSFNTGLQKRKVMYPFWVSEGLATFFEENMFSVYFKTSRYASIRKDGLVQVQKQKKLIPFDKFLSMTSLDGTVPAVNAYAQAWGIFQFLFENNKKSLKKYLSNLYTLEPGWVDEQTLHDEFTDAFGPPDELYPAWIQFVENLSK